MQPANHAMKAGNSREDNQSVNTCALLKKLPAELRNQIYELVFSPNHRKDDSVELRDATPPEGSLTRSCRQIYREASAMYRRAYRDYWTTTPFKMEHTTEELKTIREKLEAIAAVSGTLSHLKYRDLQQVS